MTKIKIGNIAKIFNGYAFKSNEYSDDGFQVIRITNVQNGYISNDNRKYIKLNNKLLEKFILNDGDILISLTGNVGRVGRIKKENLPAVLNQRVGKVIIKSKDVFPDYLFHFLKSGIVESKLIRKAKGIAQKNIGSVDIEDIEIPLPPLEDQKRIVKILDKADALRQKRKQAIGLLDDYLKSVFLKMFGDPVKNEKGWGFQKLNDLCDVGSSKRVFVDELTENGIPFYRGTEIGMLSCGEVIKPKLFITNKHYQELKKHTGVPAVGDLLMPSICPDGRIWSVDTELPFYFKDGRVLWIHVKVKSLNNIYLKYTLKEKFKNNYKSIASGTTFAELKIFALKGLSIMLPPVELQNKFAEIVEKSEKIAQSMLAQSAELETQFQVLMQKTFNC
ncbi:hypothetical protein A2303_05495 [Candidatus Falkowbacteria bacterium RIFOXYB2_FULL_47_14]|uniref:Type I restriction modification DNA specificity domain-containing protein n=1 Tax=Candidatus Falkowbacteria bacterium RIFOXYA2_FULL_47_19 TaxID=1797994 RepID=A0A1F5SEC1_9BACT|nr:MAG: hypothetical protein A2227_06900 [Candidatus Falkowbacteria bacterium RIFOXYA2_FULL_47_19]OGF35304.1 MAG: hypothetical protein A2468_00050 [Candidatus Falkowbacteria bacterium RIFOXYC2_FULL_46_15]OGF43741.1 MAG: hypothetical protein A2303_05495 [Candidatus Falkowbacteria bacterium RIFOXYB2_FULL_47_14]